MCVLYVEVKRTRNRIVTSRDGFEGRRNAFDFRTLKLVAILVEEGEAEDAKRIVVCFKLLNDQVVVLTSFNIGTVFTNAGANCFVLVFVAVFQSSNRREGIASFFEYQLGEGITGTGGPRTSILTSGRLGSISDQVL